MYCEPAVGIHTVPVADVGGAADVVGAVNDDCENNHENAVGNQTYREVLLNYHPKSFTALATETEEAHMPIIAATNQKTHKMTPKAIRRG